MAYAGETPWHKLGTFVGDQPVDAATMIRLAGLDWTVSVQSLFAQTAPRDQGGRLVRVLDRNAVVRDTDGEVLGVVGTEYDALQNTEAFGVLDDLVSDGSMRYHTAGSLAGGRRIWALGKIGSAEVIPGDRIDQFILISSAHDGSRATRVLWTQIRVVCANTERMALSSAHGEGLSVRHTRNQRSSLAQAQRILGLAQKNGEKSIEFLRRCAATELTEERWVKIASDLIPNPEDASPARAQTKREDLTRLLFRGRGQNPDTTVKRTLYDAHNAIVEWTNYHSQTRGRGDEAQERRFERTLWGGGAQFVAQADRLMVEMLGAPSDLEPSRAVDAQDLMAGLEA
jgi:phage/plasmid-like protein (TIGR03299 family)